MDALYLLRSELLSTVLVVLAVPYSAHPSALRIESSEEVECTRPPDEIDSASLLMTTRSLKGFTRAVHLPQGCLHLHLGSYPEQCPRAAILANLACQQIDMLNLWLSRPAGISR